MAPLDRIQEAVDHVRQEAIARYNARSKERDHNKQLISEGGPGAADSPERREKFRHRSSDLNMVRGLARRGALPLGIERQMGATLDWVDNTLSTPAIKAGKSVARIVDYAGPDTEPIGLATGFLVHPELMMTNWHVFQTRSDARGRAANFGYESNGRSILRGAIFELDADRFFVSDERLDFALVAVKPTSVQGTSLVELGQNTLIEATPKIMKGQSVNIIQHPNGGPKKYAISENRLVDILDAEGLLQYETDTAPGSSGSPAFNDNWELVALHRASIPEMRNGRVITTDGGYWDRDMGDDAIHWIANEGSRVSAIVGALSRMSPEKPTEQALLKALLATTSDPVADAMRLMTGGESVSAPISLFPANIDTRNPNMGNLQFLFTGPVTINVNTGAPATVTPVAPTSSTPALTSVEKAIRFDPDYDKRGGYNANFLGEGFAVPVPNVRDHRMGEMLKGDDDRPLVLKYHHFELVMNKTRRLQMWSAVNVDYDPKRKSKKDRDAFGTDRWIPDPRIPANAQIFDADFYKPAGNIDRGHIVRREDNAWGDSETEIEFANSDTFHWTNCTPQHEAFNQSSPGNNDPTYRGLSGIWGSFENRVQQQRKGTDTKACILAGPILADDDREADFGRGSIKYPLRFWKIVCIADGAENEKRLQVYGFILDQTEVVDRFGIEKFDAGKFGKYQRSLREIGEAAGLTFDDALHRADTAGAA